MKPPGLTTRSLASGGQSPWRNRSFAPASSRRLLLASPSKWMRTGLRDGAGSAWITGPQLHICTRFFARANTSLSSINTGLKARRFGPIQAFPYDARALNEFREGASDGVWFLSNPCDGVFRDIPRLVSEHNPTGRTRRAEENLTDFRHLLIESDEVDPGLWLAALVQIPLPILSIVTSGKRSIHALVRTDCHTPGQWEALIDNKWKSRLIRLGACQSSTSAVRLTRLPCCRRESENAEQKLLFLNPNPDFTPICELPEFPAPIPSSIQNLARLEGAPRSICLIPLKILAKLRALILTRTPCLIPPGLNAALLASL